MTYRRKNMEYNEIEKQFLELLNRTDFNHLSRNDVVTYASKLKATPHNCKSMKNMV